MSTRQDALTEVVDLIRRHDLSVEEVAAALRGDETFKAQKHSSILMRLFGYLGGLFILAGLAIFVAMQWDDLHSVGRILATLGVGFCVFILALVCTTREKLGAAATPLFLAAALLQPGGILVVMDEFSRGGEPAHGVLFMCLVMIIQQGCAFWVKQRTVLAFTTLFFSLVFCAVAMDLLEIPADIVGLTIGLSLTCIGWAIDRSRHQALAGLCYFFGSIFFLCGAADLLKGTVVEILFLGLACGIIFLSTVARSRALLGVGTVALLGYVGYFMDKHFDDSLAGPVGLMILGVLLIAAGVVAVKINNRFIRQKEPD